MLFSFISRHRVLERGIPRGLASQTIDGESLVLLERTDQRFEFVAVLPVVAVLDEVIRLRVPATRFELIHEPLVPRAVEHALGLAATDARVRTIRPILRADVATRLVRERVLLPRHLPGRLASRRSLRELTDNLRGLQSLDRVGVHLAVDLDPGFLLERPDGLLDIVAKVAVNVSGVLPHLVQTLLQPPNVSAGAVLPHDAGADFVLRVRVAELRSTATRRRRATTGRSWLLASTDCRPDLTNTGGPGVDLKVHLVLAATVFSVPADNSTEIRQNLLDLA